MNLTEFQSHRQKIYERVNSNLLPQLDCYLYGILLGHIADLEHRIQLLEARLKYFDVNGESDLDREIEFISSHLESEN